MRELWELSGAYWVLPLWVEWPDTPEMAAICVGAGVPLLDIQRMAAENRLQAAGARFLNDRWVIDRKTLMRFAKQSAADNPEYVVEWRPWDRRIPYRQRPPKGNPDSEITRRQRNSDEFFYEFCKLGWLSNPRQAELLWVAFMRHAMHWLMNEQRPVDFYFCEMAPTPFRPNWKELILAKWVKAKERNGEALAQLMLQDELRMWFTTQKKIIWGLDVRPLKVWFRFGAEYEKRRKSANAEDQTFAIHHYLSSVRASIQRLFPTLFRFYGSYLSQIAHGYLESHAQHIPRVDPSTQTKRPDKIRRYQKRRNGCKVADVPVAFDNRSGGIVVPAALMGGVGKVEKVSELPAVQPATPDVRQSGPEVDAPQNPPA